MRPAQAPIVYEKLWLLNVLIHLYFRPTPENYKEYAYLHDVHNWTIMLTINQLTLCLCCLY